MLRQLLVSRISSPNTGPVNKLKQLLCAGRLWCLKRCLLSIEAYYSVPILTLSLSHFDLFPDEEAIVTARSHLVLW